VFVAVHQPADLAALGGVTLVLRITLFDHRGEELGSREIHHEADLAYPDRDRLWFSDGRVYGRIGKAVNAQRFHKPWPVLDDEARDELELYGVLLRMPWLFADAESFVVFPTQNDNWRGEDLVRIPIERRPVQSLVLGPQRNPVPVDRFELLYDDTFIPRQLVFRLAATGVTRRVLLQDFREVGGVRIPWRRTFLVEDDRVAMVMKVVSFKFGQRFSDQHFRPR
jgi:hypothetical protein